MRVTYLAMRRLLPADGGGEQRVWQMVRAMAGLGWRVHLVRICAEDDAAVARRLEELGCTGARLPRLGALGALAAAAAGLPARLPLQEAFAAGPAARLAAAELARSAPDLVLVDMLRLLPLARGLRVPVVADIGDLLSLRYRRERGRHHAEKLLPLAGLPGWAAALPQRLVSRYEAAAMERRELAACRRADAVLLISAAERAALAARVPAAARARILHVPMVGQAERAAPRAGRAERRVLGLLGNLHLAGNLCALRRAVLGHGRAIAAAGLSLRVVGTPTPAAAAVVAAGRRAGVPVELAGFVPDLAAELDGWLAGLALTPVGTGMATKVLDCLAHGVPMIGTAVGFRGYPPSPALQVAADPVAAALRLAALPEPAYAALGRAAADLYDAGYAPAGLRRALAGLAERLGRRAAAPVSPAPG